MTGSRTSPIEIRRLVTHDGWFHADEVLATALLARLHPGAEILRTRDPAVLRSAGADAVVYDVGGVFDPEAGRFDHHQRGAPERPDGTPFSAFGLVWARFGRDWLREIGVDPSLVEAVAASVDESLVRPVDLLDNGLLDPISLGPAARLTLDHVIGELNLPFDDPSPEAERAGFEAAVSLAGAVLLGRARHAEARLRAAREVRAAIEENWGDPILELPRVMPFDHEIAAARADHVLLVVSPRRSGADWAVICVKETPGGLRNRLDLPAEWAGLEGPALAAATGVADAKFCHRNRFLAVAGSRQGALAMAVRALPAKEAVPEPA